VGSSVVAAAWERFSGAIIQEFIYDSWWSYLSPPDREFPAEVRWLLHHAFGEVARRARSPRVDWGSVLVRWVLDPCWWPLVVEGDDGCSGGGAVAVWFIEASRHPHASIVPPPSLPPSSQ